MYSYLGLQNISKLTKYSSFIKSISLIRLPGFSGPCIQIRYRTSQYSDQLFIDFGLRCPAHIASSTEKRKSSFFAGRLAAKVGMGALGVSEEDVGVGPRGEPLWPKTVSASLSHTDDTAMCILSCGQYRLGIDVERPMNVTDSYEVKKMIMTKFEQQYFSKFSFGKNCLTTILFSAKECLYKALYPEVQSYFDFLDVETIRVDLLCSEITFRLCKNLCAILPMNTNVVIKWSTFEDIVTYTPNS